MAQTTTGLHAILGHPRVYTAFQYLMGARSGWQRLADEHIQAKPGDAILDIGCGPADILAYLPPVRYWGFDISEDYIARARARYGERGTFACKYLAEDDLAGLPAFDVVLASGVLHHMDDDVARQLMAVARRALKPGGRLITVDPCFEDGQNPVARFLIRNDRGRNVRDAAGYRALAADLFDDVRLAVRHQAWIPYTHCYMRCVKTT